MTTGRLVCAARASVAETIPSKPCPPWKLRWSPTTRKSRPDSAARWMRRRDASGGSPRIGSWTARPTLITSADQFAGDDALLDLGGAVGDQVGHHVAQALLQRQLGRIAKVAVDLHRRFDGVLGDNRRPPLAHRSDGRVGLAGGPQPERA